MDFSKDVLRHDEQAIMRLRTIYRQFGYTQYRMSKFEEYGLYSENKAFLTSGDIITFTGAGGKLMAMRPDVTLSIVKGARDSDGMKKLYYSENVYRPDGLEFKEHMQVGLECIGDIDVYSMGEVLLLARRSLEALGERSCIDVSHMGFISGLLGSEEMTAQQRTEILRLVSGKNVPELNSLCARYSLRSGFRERITALTAIYGPYSEMVGELKRISVNDETETAQRELEDVHSVLLKMGTDGINLDFSIVNDLSYYSGVMFQGYIEGIPTKVLSGGCYDKLLHKFGRKSGAIGFAVYLDLLERLSPARSGPEVDVLLLYRDNTDTEELARTVNSLIEEGQSVRVQREAPGDIKYKRLVKV